MTTLPFHDVTQRWFSERLGEPTDVQRRAWPLLAAGGHVLVTAPTGTGKTLAAFLGCLDHLLTGRWEAGRLRVVYVSPLKALNNDIQRNLMGPLAELREAFAAAGLEAPPVRVLVRSGDTPEDERRRLRRQPPEILITTPESLNILLTQKTASELFGGVQVVILDEIHAMVGSKRGTALLTALERLIPLAGEFQRIGLSATVNPPGLVAQALGGFQEGRPRPVEVVTSTASKAYHVEVVLPAVRKQDDSGKVYWQSLALELRRRTQERDSTLIFTNSRRACEKLARLMNESVEGEENEELLAYSHHGSLSKEIRRDVEQKLKDGELKALVATNSLELGIDIGDLDEVILAEAPRSAASAIQKVGRAGHRTGEVSRARLYPSHGLDLVEAAVIVRCIRQQSVEPVVIPEGPLDVLAQTLLSTWSARPSTADAAFDLLRGTWPYRHLTRAAFDLVVDMLAGRYAGTRIRELKPRIEQDPTSGVWHSKDSVPFLLYSSGGTIPDRGYFSLRDLRTGSAIGELDEEFVWERSLGDRFALGAQVWKIAAIDDQSVRVEPVQAPPHIIPFWKAEDQDRSWFLAERIGLFLEEASRALEGDTTAWQAQLVEADGFSPEAAEQLVSTLNREKQAIGTLPHRWRVVVERVVPEQPSKEERVDADQYVVHTFWGARINRPWAFALAQAWEDRFGYALETYPGDDQILILVPPETNIGEVLAAVSPSNLEDLLRRRLEATGYFGARFREGAGRALLLPKPGFAKRTPLWQTRLRSKRLFEAVGRFPEFPILLEAWRQCLRDEFELEALKGLLDERSSGQIATWFATTSTPSPFTEGILWRQVNENMYAGDEPPARRASGLEPSLWNQLLADRPRIPRWAIEDWEARWGRTAVGYAPETPADLADLLEVRIALSVAEWNALLQACVHDSGRPRKEWEAAVALVRDGPRVGLASQEERWHDPFAVLHDWLVGRGPLPLTSLAEFWSLPLVQVEAWAQQASASGQVVTGQLSEGASEAEVCLAVTWEQLVRRMRRERRGLAPSRPLTDLPLYLARRQGLVHPQRAAGRLDSVVDRLLGLPVAADLWETVLLPSRVEPYRTAEFDQLFVEASLRWFGAGPERLTLGFPEERRDYLVDSDESAHEEALRLFAGAPPDAEVAVADLSLRSGLGLAPLTEALWRLAWTGALSATGFAPVRQGLKTGFRFDRGEPNASGRASGGGFQRWASARSSSGTWRRWEPLPAAGPPGLALQNLEEAKRRARLVLERYGIVSRALLSHEATLFSWKSLFPALRLMELSGEVVGGLFWEGLSGLQFATPEALRELEGGGDEQSLWVQYAQDPTSLCGLGLEGLTLPRRAAGTWLWWKGNRHLATLLGGGRRLEWVSREEPLEDEEIAALVRRTAGLLWCDGRTRWELESIEASPAAEHSLSPDLGKLGFRPHGDKLILWKS